MSLAAWRHVEKLKKKFANLLSDSTQSLSPEGFTALGIGLVLNELEAIRKPQNIGIAAIIVRDGKVLLGKRNTGDPSLLGHWCHPGGKVEWGEPLMKALARECTEEIKCPVSLYGGFTSVQERTHEHRHTVMIFYRCRIHDGHEPEAGDGFSEIKWFSMEDIQLLISQQIITPMSEGAMKDFFELDL